MTTTLGTATMMTPMKRRLTRKQLHHSLHFELDTEKWNDKLEIELIVC